jgi:hypothetical protein
MQPLACANRISQSKPVLVDKGTVLQPPSSCFFYPSALTDLAKIPKTETVFYPLILQNLHRKIINQ